MAEEKTTKAKSTAKKSAAKKTTAKKSATKKAAPKPKPEPAVKKFEMQTPIRCRSVRQNGLIYKSSANNVIYTWEGYGDIRELPYQDVLAMKSRRSAFLYKPWIIIEDEDLLAEKNFAGEFDEMYALYHEFDTPEEFFNKKPSEIRAMLKKAPEGMRDLILFNAGRFIDEGILDSIGVINAIDDVFGTQLKMLL